MQSISIVIFHSILAAESFDPTLIRKFQQFHFQFTLFGTPALVLLIKLFNLFFHLQNFIYMFSFWGWFVSDVKLLKEVKNGILNY